MVTFCKFSQKYFILFVFFLSSTGDNLSPLHRPNSCPLRSPATPRPCPPPRAGCPPPRGGQPSPHAAPVKAHPSPHRINPGSTILTPTFSAPPERKCQKKSQTYPPFALQYPHSPRARAQYLRGRACARGNIRAARSGCARPRRRVYNIAAGLASCCRAGGLLPGWRPAAGLSGCCLAGGLLLGWRVAAGLASCCRAVWLLLGWRAAAGLAGCCWAGGLLLGWRVAAGLAGCCWAGGLLPGWRVATGLAGCCLAGVLLPGRPGWRSGPILCSLCKLHSRTP